MDSFRMPIAYREKKEVEKFDYKDVLSGGANRGYLYQWCFLAIDVHSKVVFLEHIHQNTIFQQVAMSSNDAKYK